MIKDIRHTGIVVKDLKSSVHFYRDLLGLKIIKKMEESGEYIDNLLFLKQVRVITVKMSSRSGQMVELIEYLSHSAEQETRGISEIGISHIAFTVNNLDVEYERLKNKGVKFNSHPQLSPDGYAKVLFCKAPEGTFIELVEVLP